VCRQLSLSGIELLQECCWGRNGFSPISIALAVKCGRIFRARAPKPQPSLLGYKTVRLASNCSTARARPLLPSPVMILHGRWRFSCPITLLSVQRSERHAITEKLYRPQHPAHREAFSQNSILRLPGQQWFCRQRASLGSLGYALVTRYPWS
jgi:hypothetical protein